MLNDGCVQEEIMFVIKPECLVSILICEKMKDNESILITNAVQYSKYKGYSDTFEFEVKNEIDFDQNILAYIAAIDAINYRTIFSSE